MQHLKNNDFDFYFQQDLNYQEFLNLQNDLTLIAREKKKNSLIICNHPTLLTNGKGDRQNKHLNNNSIIPESLEVYDINRGGGITFHSTNQLIIYPIIKLNQTFGLNAYLDWLTSLVSKLVKELVGLELEYKRKPLGLWYQTHKVASIGVGIERFVTNHGIALNVEEIPLEANVFQKLAPCGLNSDTYSSLKEFNNESNVDDFFDLMVRKVDSNFYTISS